MFLSFSSVIVKERSGSGSDRWCDGRNNLVLLGVRIDGAADGKRRSGSSPEDVLGSQRSLSKRSIERARERLRRSKQFLLRGKTDDAYHAQEGKAEGGREGGR